MLKMMVRSRKAPCLLLGIGTYYVSAAHDTQLGAYRWRILELNNPLIVDRQHVRGLFRRHRTNAPDHKIALAGAWKLRQEATSKGYDGIIAVDGTGAGRHLTIAHFDTGLGTGAVMTLPARNRAKLGVPSASAFAKAS